MRHVSIRDFQRNFYTEIKDLPLVVERRGVPLFEVFQPGTNVTTNVTTMPKKVATKPNGPPSGFKFPTTPAFTKDPTLPSSNPGYAYGDLCATCGRQFDRGPHTRYSENPHPFARQA